MAGDSVFSKLSTDDDGAWTAEYGAYTLRSALQPIFSQDEHGALEVQAFEGLIRPSRGGEPVRPAEFFPDVAPQDRARYWNEIADRVFTGTFVNVPGEDFAGRMLAWRVGQLDMIRTDSTPSS